MKKRLLAAAAAALLLLAATAGTALAAEDRTPIESIHLDINSTIEPGGSSGDVYVTTSDSEYRVGEVEILNEADDWKGGMQPRFTVSLYAKSGYYFKSTSKNVFSLSGDDATYVTARREDNRSSVIVTLKLDKLDNGDLSVSGLEWDESSGTAMWDENPSARYYQVKLFRDGSSETSSRTTYDTWYDFSGDITRRGDYHFEVRSVGSGSEKGDWESSDTWFVTSWEADDLSYDRYPENAGPGVSGSSSSSGTYVSGGPGAGSGGSTQGRLDSQGGHWCLDQYGWWYQNADGSYTRNNWQIIGGLYYFFNESGYMRTGWIPWNGKWYYCGPSGELWSNCRTPDGYYVGGDGVWIP